MDFELQKAIEILERTPKTLSALLAGLSEDWILADEDTETEEGTFSPKDVVGHLVSGEEVDWVARTEIILRYGSERPFDSFDRFGFREQYRDRSLPELLELFETLRARNLEKLRSLDIGPEALKLEGLHPELGRVTLKQLLATWVVHDLAHIRQIARVMAKQYRDAVGPWREYLRVLEE